MNYSSIEELVDKYPVLGTEAKFNKLSNKYEVVSTADMLRRLDEKDMEVVAVSVQKPRKADKYGFQKHCVTLRKRDIDPGPLKTVPQILLTNSHDGTTAFRVQLGFFRFVCANGLVVGRQTMKPLSVRHDIGDPVKYVGFAVDHALGKAEQAYRAIHNMRMASHVDSEQTEARLASRLLEGIYDGRDDIDGSRYNFWRKFAQPANRNDAREFHLWSLYNRVQHNFVNGKYVRPDKDGFAVKGRAIKGIDRLMKVNEQLWDNAVRMAA